MKPIEFPFNEDKATAASVRFLKRAGGAMKYFKLIKLLYLADREGLDKLGVPISGDAPTSMEHGPVLSRIYDLMKKTVEKPGANQPDSPIWDSAISRVDRYRIAAKPEALEDALSIAEIKIIDSIYRQFEHMDQWEVRDWIHDHCKEWVKPKNNTSAPIPVITILQTIGKSRREIDEIREEARRDTLIEALGC